MAVIGASAKNPPVMKLPDGGDANRFWGEGGVGSSLSLKGQNFSANVLLMFLVAFPSMTASFNAFLFDIVFGILVY